MRKRTIRYLVFRIHRKRASLHYLTGLAPRDIIRKAPQTCFEQEV